MKKLFTVMMVLMAIAIFFSCKKDEGTVRFTNTSKDPYSIYIDGTSRTAIAGNTYMDYSVSSGTHSYEVVQQSGFILTPTDEKGNFTVAKAGTANVTFP